MLKSKYKNVLFIAIFFIITFILSILIGVLIKNIYTKEETPVNENDVILIADTDTIEINNRFSVSDDFGVNISDDNGGTFVFYEFSISNHALEKRNYEIYITQIDNGSDTFNLQYLKVYLSTNNNVGLNNYATSVPTYPKIPFMVDKPSSKLIYSGTISEHCTSSFILRVWLSENYVPPLEEKSATFEVHVRAV